VRSSAVSPARVTEPDWLPDRQQVTYLSLRLLAAAPMAFVIITSFQSRPAPGGKGEALAVSVVLVAFCCATAAAMLMGRVTQAIQLAVVLIAVISAAAIVGIQGNGAAFIGVFPVVSLAALQLPTAISATVAGTAVAAVSAAWTWHGDVRVAGIILNDFGILAFYVLSLFAARLRDSNNRTALLLAELEETRSAQALAAALAERQRLAREMHDVLAHSLSGLVLNLESARLVADHGKAAPQIKDAIDRSHRLARTGLEEARRAIDMLRGDELPGPERLPTLAAEFERDTGVACTLAVNGDERDLGTEGRLTFYRIAQEALTNIRKHAHPDRVEICLGYLPSGTRLTIENFGQSDEHTAPATGTGYGLTGTGYGLTGMRERAELLGGTLVAEKTDAGFLVDFWVPA
jgi:signal transduction histidine kinase